MPHTTLKVLRTSTDRSGPEPTISLLGSITYPMGVSHKFVYTVSHNKVSIYPTLPGAVYADIRNRIQHTIAYKNVL